MGGLPKPKQNKYFHSGARAGWDFDTLEEALESKELKEELEGSKLTDSQREYFKRGYYTGRCTEAVNDIGNWYRFMDEEQIIRVGKELTDLRDRINEELSRDDAAYKVGAIKGVPKQ